MLRVVVPVFLACLVAVAAAPAEAGPPINPAVSVYVEQIPTAAGSVPSGASRGGRAVSRSVSNRIRAQAGSDATGLERLVASGEGAPGTASSGGAGSARGIPANAAALAVAAAVVAAVMVIARRRRPLPVR
jgi:hypothetical protein